MKTYPDDDLSRSENKCLSNCFHKYYRYLSYSNTLYSYLVADEDADKKIIASQKNESQVEQEQNSDEML